MRYALFTLGLVSGLAACGRSGSAARDAGNAAAQDVPGLPNLDSPAASGDAAGALDSLPASGTGGTVGSGGSMAVYGSGGRYDAGGGASGEPDSAGAGGVGQGGATGAGGATAVNCGITTVSTVRAHNDVLLVLDRSGSMGSDIARDCACPGSSSGGTTCPAELPCQDRWSALSSAVAAAVASSPETRWGLKLFATPGDSACTVSTQVEVPFAADAADAILESIAGIAPGGNTPTAQAIAAATAYLKTVDDPNNKLIVLATDGEPNCGPGSSTSTSNLAGTAAAIAEARSLGFPVYVIGIGPSVGNLDELAAAGGTGRYYPATSATALTQALAAVSVLAAPCNVSLFTLPPDPDNVAVYLDKGMVARDDRNGWSYLDAQTIALSGDACARLLASQVATVTVLFGCPGQSPPPVLP